jgi:hypothetical protein
MSARSPFYKALFLGGMKESSEKILEISGVSSAVFKEFLR